MGGLDGDSAAITWSPSSGWDGNRVSDSSLLQHSCLESVSHYLSKPCCDTYDVISVPFWYIALRLFHWSCGFVSTRGDETSPRFSLLPDKALLSRRASVSFAAGISQHSQMPTYWTAGEVPVHAPQKIPNPQAIEFSKKQETNHCP